MNSPIVPTNHSAATGHRWRALHIATRTVVGSRPVWPVGGSVGWDSSVVIVGGVYPPRSP